MAAWRVVSGSRASRVTAILLTVVLIVLATMPAWGSRGWMNLAIQFLTLLAMAQMWNLMAGYAGLISIGQQAFVGLGAYLLFLATDRAGLGLLPAMAVVIVGAVVAAAVTSIFAFRLRDGYFAIGTWVIAEVFRLAFANWGYVGAGVGVSLSAVTEIPVDERQAVTYWLALAVGFGSILVAVLLMRSRVGLALRAIRDSEMAAQGVGVDSFRTKLSVYLVASTVCAVAGAVLFLQLLRIQPNSAFSVNFTAEMIFIVLIGGIGSIEGPIIGAVVFFLLQETLADFGSLYLVILGAAAILITLLAPRGLWGLWVRRFPMTLFDAHRRLVIEGGG